MNIDSFINDIALLSAANDSLPEVDKQRTSLAAQWLAYRPLPQQVRSIAEQQASAGRPPAAPVPGPDSVFNLRAILAQIRELLEITGQLNSEPPEGLSTREVRQKVAQATAAMDNALYRQHKFAMAVRDYRTLPDKMADDVILFLSQKRSRMQAPPRST